MKLVFTTLARQDLGRLREFFLAGNNPDAARRAAARIKAASLLIAQQPHMGRVVRVPVSSNLDVRELPVSFGASGYLIRYQVLSNEVRVLRIWHARENWQDPE
ncbi:MAG TPA: type II toxin-antitoxin system RelE/ParE family toxin [Thermoanaerobaculia bacterium]|nr:type II toxin-antitoxin system RelE/ParE family toxin [Thermoanaerobaculia bacterium]